MESYARCLLLLTVCYPVVYTLSFTGEHSKITLNTKNVFIEATATDLQKVSISFGHFIPF